MHKVKNPGPGGEGVFSCVGVIRTGDAVKGSDADLHVMVLFSAGGYFRFLGSLPFQTVCVNCICGKTMQSIFNILVPSASSMSSTSNCRVWRLYLYSKVAFSPLAATMCQNVNCINMMNISLCYLYVCCISIIFHVTSYAVA